MDEGTAWERWATSGASLGGGEDRWLQGAGVRLHVVTRGAGPPVVLLHGFPDFWFGWRLQMPALADAGFAAIAPDLRGHNLSDCPARVEDYRTDLLADDVAALVRAAGHARAHVVGHDWGGLVAWHLAVRHPDVVDRLAILNAPHPGRFRQLLVRSSQAVRSWYAALFQLPRLPEWLMRRRRFAALRGSLRSMHRRPGAFTRSDEAAYLAAFAAPGRLRAAVHYYRARARHGVVLPPEGRTVRHETLVLWGERDPALVPANAAGLERWVPRVRVVRVPEAGHWVQADAPDVVNRELVAFLRG